MDTEWSVIGNPDVTQKLPKDRKWNAGSQNFKRGVTSNQGTPTNFKRKRKNRSAASNQAEKENNYTR